MNRPIIAQFIAFLVGKLSITDFAEWIPSHTAELNAVLSPTDYAELMTIDFQSPQAPSLLDRMLREYVDWAQYEKEKLAELLMAIIWKDDAPRALVSAHEQFRQGLRFLNVLGNEYGRTIAKVHGTVPKSEDEEDRLLTAIYPKAREEAKRLLSCLVADKIKFTGTYTQEGYPEYIEQ